MIKKVTKKQNEQGVSLALGVTYQKALEKLDKYYNAILTYGHISIATICDPRFNFNVFNIVMESNREDNGKKARIKGHFKNYFYKYQDWESNIKHARFLKEQAKALEIQEDEAKEEESNVGLYWKGPTELDSKMELIKYLKQLVQPRDTTQIPAKTIGIYLTDPPDMDLGT